MKKRFNTLSLQEQYIYRHHLEHRTITFLRFFMLLVFLCLWEIASRLGWIDSFFFSSPSMVYGCFMELLTVKALHEHILITLAETIISFLFVMLLSFLSAFLLWFFPKAERCLEPFLVVLNSLPKSALAPLIMVWIGTGIKTVILCGMSVAIFGSILSFYTSFHEADTDKLLLIRTLNGNRIQQFLYVVFPGSMPELLNCAKVNIGLTLVGVIIGEFLAAKKGLGYLIIYGSQVFQLNLVITSIMLLCLMAMLLYQIMEFFLHYYKKHKG